MGYKCIICSFINTGLKGCTMGAWVAYFIETRKGVIILIINEKFVNHYFLMHGFPLIEMFYITTHLKMC